MSHVKEAALKASQILDASSSDLSSKLSIVIAVYDSLNYTKDCIDSIVEHAPGAEIIIVNNGSQPETKEYLDNTRGIRVIHWDENRGVSKAWNAGLKIATREMLCVLNNDVLVQPSGMQMLIQAAQECGVAGNEGACMNTDFNYAYSTYNEEEADYLGGYCIVFTRDVWNKVGQFDEYFSPAYWEDNDWGLRVKGAGYKWRIIPNCVYHYVARTSLRVLDMSSLFAKQREKFLLKWGEKAIGLGERILILCDEQPDLKLIQQCVTEMRLRKPFCKIHVQTDAVDSIYGCDYVSTEARFKQYTHSINYREYLQKPLFSFISWVNNETHYRTLLKSSHTIKAEYIRIGQEVDSLSKAYNLGTERASGKYLVYVHQDVEILDNQFEQKLHRVFQREDLGFVGVIGSLTRDNTKSVWFQEGAHNCRGIAIQNRYEAVNLGVYNGEAALIDGLMMITDKRFNFPESLPHVHFLDAWMCNVAAGDGYKNWITDIWVNHNSGGETHSDFFKNNLIRYRLKWFSNGAWSSNYGFNDIKSMLSVVKTNLEVRSGIAITTRNRPEMLDACLLHFKTYSSKEQLRHLIIYDDASTHELRLKNQAIVKKHGMEDRYYCGKKQVGVAQAKNCCLYLLGNTYSYYFLFDDDAFPINNGWMELYINAHHQSGYQHLLYGNNVHNSIGGQADGIEFYDQGFGVLIFFTKSMYEALGGFCSAFGLYGTEHTDYTLRAQKAGMTSMLHPYAGPINCAEYIWNHETRAPYQKTLVEIPGHEESITREQKNSYLAISVEHDSTINHDRPIYYPIKIEHEIIRYKNVL